jgi:kynurenine formamidase
MSRPRFFSGLAVSTALFAACGSPAPQPASPAPATQATSAASAWPAGSVVDLSHAYDDRTVFWPTAERFELTKVADGMTPQGYYYAANTFRTSEHGGTHIDSPVHFARNGWTVDQIPLDRLIAPAIVVDVRQASAANADYQVQRSDFEAWERAHGSIPAGVIVLLHTGFSARWPDAARYLGTAERGQAAVAKLHFPGLHPDAARWLVAERSIKAIGLDTASIDFGQSTLYESHRILFEKNIPALENLTNLDRLPATGARIVALPMKIGGGSGGPVRAVAFLPG